MKIWNVPTGMMSDNIWERFVKNESIFFGCGVVGNLNTISKGALASPSNNDQTNDLDFTKGEKSSLLALYEGMQTGDKVVARTGDSTILGIGEVDDRGYYYSDGYSKNYDAKEKSYTHARGVTWLYIGKRQRPEDVPPFKCTSFIYQIMDKIIYEKIKALYT